MFCEIWGTMSTCPRDMQYYIELMQSTFALLAATVHPLPCIGNHTLWLGCDRNGNKLYQPICQYGYNRISVIGR